MQDSYADTYEKILGLLQQISSKLDNLAEEMRLSWPWNEQRRRRPALGFKIRQRIPTYEVDIMADVILGIKPGASGNFVAAIVPAGGALQAGSVPVWSADNPDIVLTVNPADPSGLSVAAAVPASESASSFNLKISGVNSAGAAISESANVPILQPLPPPATGFSITQTS